MIEGNGQIVVWGAVQRAVDGADGRTIIGHGAARHGDQAHIAHQHLVVAGILVGGADADGQIATAPHAVAGKVGLVGDRDGAAVHHHRRGGIIDLGGRNRAGIGQCRRAGAGDIDGVDARRRRSDAARFIPAALHRQIEGVGRGHRRRGARRIQQRIHRRLIGAGDMDHQLGGADAGDGIAVAQGIGRHAPLAGDGHLRQGVIGGVGGEIGAGDRQVGGVGIVEHAGELVILEAKIADITIAVGCAAVVAAAENIAGGGMGSEQFARRRGDQVLAGDVGLAEASRRSNRFPGVGTAVIAVNGGAIGQIQGARRIGGHGYLAARQGLTDLSQTAINAGGGADVDVAVIAPIRHVELIVGSDRHGIGAGVSIEALAIDERGDVLAVRRDPYRPHEVLPEIKSLSHDVEVIRPRNERHIAVRVIVGTVAAYDLKPAVTVAGGASPGRVR